MACVTLAQEDEICIVNSKEEADDDDQIKLKNGNLIDIETGDDNNVNKIMHSDLKIIFILHYKNQFNMDQPKNLVCTFIYSKCLHL